jgi:hypothetical protein
VHVDGLSRSSVWSVTGRPTAGRNRQIQVERRWGKKKEGDGEEEKKESMWSEHEK